MFEDRKVKVFLLTLVVALSAGIAIKTFVSFKAPQAAPAALEPAGHTSQNAGPTSQNGSQEIVVYVTGAVVKQGLVRLPLGSRLADALLSAGQAQDSDLTNLNLAEKLRDGQKIVVPRVGEQAAAGVGPVQGSGSNTVGTSSGSGMAGKININTAGAKELDAIPGIGPATAEKIIAFRNEKGPFNRPEDIKQVPGIGEKKFAEMAEFITVD